MPLSSLPNECFIVVLSFLDNKSLYKCLFVNRYYCKLSIPIIWREPFKSTSTRMKSMVINTLLACLDEDEFSILMPYAIKFTRNNKQPLFEYGKFVRILDHEVLSLNVTTWLKSSTNDCRVQGLVDAIYHMIMRQGSNLQEFRLDIFQDIDLPKLPTIMTYKPGFTNLRYLDLKIDFGYNSVKCQNTIEFLSMISTFCNGIADFYLWIYGLNGVFFKSILNIIKLQPLEKMLMYFCNTKGQLDLKKFIYTIEFRSETLKELLFNHLVFQSNDLSFIPKLKCLECLEFVNCIGLTSKHVENLSKKLHLKKLKLWFDDTNYLKENFIKPDSLSNVVKAMVNSLCNEILLKLSLNIVTPEIVKAVKDSCPNISFLHIKIFTDQFLHLTIPLICELSSLKVLYIQIEAKPEVEDLFVKILGDFLTSVEYLTLDFYMGLKSFEYFTNNCKANLKKWNILVDKSFRKDFLKYVDNYQKIHNSLKVLGIEIEEYDNYDFVWTNEELEIVGSLSNQGVDIVPFNESSVIKSLFHFIYN